MKIQAVHYFDLPPDRFVELVFFNPEFNVALHDHLDFKSREVIERREDDDTVWQRVEFHTKQKLPWVARKLFGHDDVGWVEEMHFHKAQRKLETRLLPFMFEKRVHSSGVVTFEDDGNGGCKRVYDFDVSISLPAVGKAIAKKMAAETHDGIEKAAEFTRRWIAERRLAETA